jgi:hypothetical protein
MVIINGKNVSHLLVGHRDVETSDAVWLDGAGDSFTDDNLAFIEEIGNQPIGRKFQEKFGLSPNFDAVMATAWKLYPTAPFITTGRFLDALKTLMAGSPDKLIAKVVPVAAAPAAPAPPVDKNGRVLGASQKAWQEHAEWSRTASSRDIAERRRVDPSFAKFYASSLQIEMTQPIDGDVRPFNPHLLPSTTPSNAEAQGIAAKASLLLPQLQAFAAEYVTTPAARVKFLRSTANPFHAQYESSFQACLEAKLI